MVHVEFCESARKRVTRDRSMVKSVSVRCHTTDRTDRTEDQRSEFRRIKRAEERTASMRCYVCRESGHSAKDCPQNVGGATGKDTVGICFRCGSTEHTLAKCRRTVKGDELPFATCYICSRKVRSCATKTNTRATWRPSALKIKVVAYTQRAASAKCVTLWNTLPRTARWIRDACHTLLRSRLAVSGLWAIHAAQAPTKTSFICWRSSVPRQTHAYLPSLSKRSLRCNFILGY